MDFVTNFFRLNNKVILLQKQLFSVLQAPRSQETNCITAIKEIKERGSQRNLYLQ